MTLSPWMLLPLAAFLVGLYLFAYLNAANRRDRPNRSCLLFILAYLVYVAHDSIFFWLPMRDSRVLPFLRIGPAIYVVMPLLLTDFIYAIIGRKRDVPYWVISGICAIIAALGISTPLFFPGWFAASWGRAAMPGPLHPAFGFSMIAAIAWAMVLLVRALRSDTRPDTRSIYRIIILGVGIVVVVGLVTNVVIPDVIGKKDFFPLASSSTLAFSVAMYLAVRRHNFLTFDRRQIENTFRFLFDTIDSGVVIVDCRLRVVQINPAALRTFGLNPKSPPTSLTAILPGYDSTRIHTHEEMAVRVGDEIRTVVLSDAPLGKSPLGPGRILLVQDISEMTRILDEIQVQEEKWRSLVESAPDIILMVNRQARILFMNHSLSETPTERYKGLSVFDFASPGYHENMRTSMEEVFGDGRNRSITVHGRRIDGVEMWFEAHIGPVRALDGTIDALMLVTRDITERVAAEKRVQELNENLEKLVKERTEELRASQAQLFQSEKLRAIGQLAGGVAHDFNNQLSGIMACADRLRLSLAHDPGLFTYADTIVRAAERSAGLTAQLLAFARKGPAKRVPVNIHGVIAEAVSLLGHTLGPSIRIRQHLDAARAVVNGDPAQFQNAFLNMGINCRDAMPEGGEILFATQQAVLTAQKAREIGAEAGEGTYVQVSVSDTGAGMSAAVLAQIFEPFFSTKEIGKGIGMGLAAVYGTAKQAGGGISAASVENQGTTITLHLPCAAVSQSLPAGADAEPMAAIGRKLNVLVVDDEQVVRMSVRKVLESLDHGAKECASGAEAVEYFSRHWRDIDVVLLDMVMPGMSGRETFDRIRDICQDARVILSSGYSADSQIEEALAAGAKGFLRKPYLLSELSKSITEALA